LSYCKLLLLLLERKAICFVYSGEKKTRESSVVESPKNSRARLLSELCRARLDPGKSEIAPDSTRPTCAPPLHRISGFPSHPPSPSTPASSSSSSRRPPPSPPPPLGGRLSHTHRSRGLRRPHDYDDAAPSRGTCSPSLARSLAPISAASPPSPPRRSRVLGFAPGFTRRAGSDPSARALPSSQQQQEDDEMLVPHQELPVAGPEAAPQPMEGEDLSLPAPSVLVLVGLRVSSSR